MNAKNKSITMRRESPDLINYIVVSIVLLALIGTAVMTWLTLQHPESTPSLIAVVKPKATPDSVKISQELTLNTAHQHVGPVVQVDTSKIGKDNPFR